MKHRFSLVFILGLIVFSNFMPLLAQTSVKTNKTSAAVIKPIQNVYNVKNALELKYLIDLKTNFEGYTIRLEADIDFGEKTPLTTGFKSFAGTFEGNNKIIRNFKMITSMNDYESRGSAFFFTNKGTIQNLTIDGSISGLIELALLVGENNGSLINCTSRGTVAVGSKGAGLVYQNSGTITGCKNYAEVKPKGRSTDPSYFAGIAVFNGGEIVDSANYGSITGSINVAGIAVEAEFPYSGEFIRCTNYGEIKGNKNISGILAYADGSFKMDGCINAGVVRASKENCAGIIANNQGSGNLVKNCKNTGLVSGGTTMTAGIIAKDGDQSNRRNAYEDCGNSGIVESKGTRVAGIIAYQNSNITRCWNLGTVSGSSSVGGISAAYSNTSSDKIEISSCFNAGSVSGVSNVGGIIGYKHRFIEISKCYNSGFVSGEEYIAGIAGHAEGQINNVYNIGTIQATTNAAGISSYGFQMMGNSSFIDASYNAGKVSNTPFACLIGHIYGFRKQLNNYYRSEFSQNLKGVFYYMMDSALDLVEDDDPSLPNIVFAKPLSDEAFAKKESFIGFDFSTVWSMGRGFKDSDESQTNKPLSERPLLRGVGEANGEVYKILVSNSKAERLALNKLLTDLTKAELNKTEIGTAVKEIDGVFLVKTADELRYLMNQKTDYKGKTIRLLGDIDFGKDRFLTIGFSRMAGTFDGAGFALKNLNIRTDDSPYLDSFPQSIGFIGIIEKTGKVLNVHIESGSIDGGERVGAIAGHSSGIIMNCTNKASVIGNSGATVGGIVGIIDSRPGEDLRMININYEKLVNCSNSGSVSGYQASGIAGYSRTAHIVDCTNSGKILGYYTAGIAHSSLSVVSCINTGVVGDVETTKSAGILAPDSMNETFGSGNDNGIMLNCANSGTITAQIVAAGIIIESTSPIVNCANTGAVSVLAKDPSLGYLKREKSNVNSSSASGGILAYAHDDIMMVNCFNTGKISANVGSAGGLIGLDISELIDYRQGCDSESNYYLYHCYSVGEVSSLKGLAGILIGEKAKLDWTEYKIDDFGPIAQAEGVYYLKSSTKNAKIPAVNFSNSAKVKVNQTGLLELGDSGFNKLPDDWDKSIWKMQSATKTSMARPILSLDAVVLEPVSLVQESSTEPAKYKFGDKASELAIIIYDKGRTSNSWRYLELYENMYPEAWAEEANIIGGNWFHPSKEDLNMVYQTLYLKERRAFSPGFYYIVPEVDETHIQVMDFFTGRVMVVPKAFKAFSLSLRKL